MTRAAGNRPAPHAHPVAGSGPRRCGDRIGRLGLRGRGQALRGERPGSRRSLVHSVAPGWSAPRSGLTVFTVKNTSRDTIYGVDLVGANQVLVYGDIEMLAPGTEDQMEALLPPGDYLFECESFAGATLTSRVGRVSGPCYRSPPLRPGDVRPDPAGDVDVPEQPQCMDGASRGGHRRA